MVHVYALSDERGAIRYIGITEQTLRARLHRHVSKANTAPTTATAKWLRSMAPSRPEIHCLLQVEKREAAFAERQFIAAMREAGVVLTNSTDGGCGTPGHRKGIAMSAEQRQKISAALKGRSTGPKSEAHRASLSAARMGFKPSAATVEKLRRYPRTPEANEQRSMTMKARLADPAIRAQMSERRRQENADPAMRARKSLACKAAWARHKAASITA